MKDFLKRVKADFLLSSIMCILLGVVFIIWKESVLDVIGSILAFGLILIGVVYLCSFFLKMVTNGFSVVMGIIVLAVGIWFLINPSIVFSLIPIAIGVVLIFHSIRGIIEAATAMKYEYRHLGIGMIMSVISLILGVFCGVMLARHFHNAGSTALGGLLALVGGVSGAVVVEVFMQMLPSIAKKAIKNVVEKNIK